MNYRKGIDVSKWQGSIAWHRVYESGVTDAMIKLSEVNIDPMAQWHLDTIARLNATIDPRKQSLDGIKAGVYHLWRPTLGMRQCDRVADMAPHLPHGLAIDLETKRLKEATGMQMDGMIRMSHYLAKDMPGGIMIYMSARGAKVMRERGRWDGYWQPGMRLWLMCRGMVAKPIPGAPEWSWWQWSSSALVPGVRSGVDCNHVRG